MALMLREVDLRHLPGRVMNLTQMEADLLDVTAVPDALARSTRWKEGIPRVFEGLRVVTPRGGIRAGRVATFGFGPGRIAGIEGTAQRVSRRPSRSDRTSGFFNVLLQVAGTCRLAHAGESIAMTPGSLTLVDGAGAFEMHFTGGFKHLLFQLPRDIVLRRYEGLGSMAGCLFERGLFSTDLVFGAYSAFARAVEGLVAEQRAHAFEACVAYLGVLRTAQAMQRVDHYSRAAADIEAELSDPNLNASVVAERLRLSRRRLDEIFRARSTTVAAWIWERRLQRIAEEMADPNLLHRKLIDIAFSFGFSDAAHFSRAFRKRFGAGPRNWRQRYCQGSR